MSLECSVREDASVTISPVLNEPRPSPEPLDKRSCHPRLGAWLVWWYLVAGGLASHLAKDLGFWFDGFDFLQVVVLPSVALILLYSSVIRGYQRAGLPAVLLTYSLFLMLAIAVASRLQYIVQATDLETARGILVRPLGVVFGLLLGTAVGHREEDLRVLTDVKSSFLVIAALAFVMIQWANRPGEGRIGGREIFGIADALSYVLIGQLAPTVVRGSLSTAAVGILLGLAVLTVVGLRSAVVSMLVSSSILVVLARLSSRRRPGVRRRDLYGMVSVGLLVPVVGAVLLHARSERWGPALQRLNPIWTFAWTSDESGLLRIEQLRHGMEISLASVRDLVVGRFSYADFELGAGAYVHSILSMLPEFGLPALLVTMVLIGMSMRALTGRIGASAERVTAAWLLLYWLVSGILARTYFTTHFWFAIGLALSCVGESKRCRDARRQRAIGTS